MADSLLRRRVRRVAFSRAQSRARARCAGCRATRGRGCPPRPPARAAIRSVTCSPANFERSTSIGCQCGVSLRFRWSTCRSSVSKAPPRRSETTMRLISGCSCMFSRRGHADEAGVDLQARARRHLELPVETAAPLPEAHAERATVVASRQARGRLGLVALLARLVAHPGARAVARSGRSPSLRDRRRVRAPGSRSSSPTGKYGAMR